MRGAVIFLIAFVIFLAVTFFAYPQLPPGYNISAAINVEDVIWNEIEVITLSSAIFNGIIYGIIIWLIFSLIDKARGKGEQKTPVETKEAVKNEIPVETKTEETE